MAYEKVYSRINWENEPSTKSPINEENLNKIDFALNEIDNRTVELSGYESVVIDYSNQAKTSAANALSSETKAKTSEQNAYSYEQSALTSKNQAEVFKNEAETHANNASDSEINAKDSEDNASASELLAKNSEENARGFAESAETSAQKAKASEDIAVTSASSAKTDSDLAKSYTVGTHGEVRENDDSDNAKYYYEQTKGISQSLSGALKPMGTIVFDNLPSSPNSGDMYNISNEFITDDRFKEGIGKTMPIGTNVYFTEDGYWDCLAGSPVTGIKGSNETSYRQGNVEITPDDLGLSTVATSGSYADLSNKPTIPSVGNGTITIKQAGSTKGSFTMNQSGNTTIELTDNNTTYGIATQSADGLESADDKKKLDGIATGANKTSIANNLTTTSSGYALDARQGKAIDDRLLFLELTSKRYPRGWQAWNYVLNGYITGGAKTIVVGIPITTGAENSKPTVASFKVNIRGINGYLGQDSFSSDGIEYVGKSGITIGIDKCGSDSNCVLKINSTTPFSHATNNTPVSIEVIFMQIDWS